MYIGQHSGAALPQKLFKILVWPFQTFFLFASVFFFSNELFFGSSKTKKKIGNRRKTSEKDQSKCFEKAFGCTQHMKAGQNTQHRAYFVKRFAKMKSLSL